jgi:DNA-binding response OmpR family regulator
MKNSEIKSAEASSAASILDPAQSSQSIRILLVDDDYYLRELNAGVLIRFGYVVDTAGDGADAWKALNAASYDLLITDNGMPKVTGMELIKKLRSEDMTLPVILASGTVPEEELKRHPWLRVDALLPKPFTLAEFLDTVKKVLSATNQVFNTSQLFRDYALREDKIPNSRKSDYEPIQEQANLHQRILVVDDDKDTRQLSVDVLIGSGYDVEGVRDGAAGWEALQNDSYDLVITDNQMPRMTGLEMIEKLRAARMTLPVIMATRYLPTHEFIRRPWLKPDAALERPFSTDDLLATVKKILHPGDGGDDRRETLFPNHL